MNIQKISSNSKSVNFGAKLDIGSRLWVEVFNNSHVNSQAPDKLINPIMEQILNYTKKGAKQSEKIKWAFDTVKGFKNEEEVISFRLKLDPKFKIDKNSNYAAFSHNISCPFVYQAINQEGVEITHMRTSQNHNWADFLIHVAKKLQKLTENPLLMEKFNKKKPINNVKPEIELIKNPKYTGVSTVKTNSKR